MNLKNIQLSSINTQQTTNFNTVVLNDHTNVYFNLSGVTEKMLPLYLNVNWGDNKEELFENDILNGKNIISNKFSSILDDIYSHEYFPSDTTTTKSLTAVFTIKYINNDISTFNIPLSIINYDYSQAIEDLQLINTVLLPNTNNEKIHQFITKKGGYLIELKTSI